MHEVKCRLGSTLKQFDFMEVRVSRHKHSNRYLSSFFVFLNIRIIIVPSHARARNHEEMVSVDDK